MSEPEKCARCKARAESNDNIQETTFWGSIAKETTTTVARRIRFVAAYVNRKSGSNMLVDEQQALCSDCWGLLIGRFLQGRDVPAIPGKVGW